MSLEISKDDLEWLSDLADIVEDLPVPRGPETKTISWMMNEFGPRVKDALTEFTDADGAPDTIPDPLAFMSFDSVKEIDVKNMHMRG